jgi:excisionase family DNA binding protein
MMGSSLDAIQKLVARMQVEKLEKKLAAMSEELSKRSSGQQGDELLTSKQLAPILGVQHHKTVEQWTRTKGLPCVRIGRNLRFRLGDVQLWLAQRKES